MRRRTRILGLTVALIAAGVAAGAVAYRTAIAESLLIDALAKRGIPDPRLSVSGVGWRSARLTDLRLGDADEVSLRDLRVDYSLPGLLAGRIDDVTANGLAVTLDLTGAGPPLGSLQTFFARSDTGDNGGRAPSIPNVQITDMRVTAHTVRGVVQATGSGSLRNDETGTGVELSLPEIALNGEKMATGLLAADLASDEAEASLSLHTLAGDFSVDASLSVKDPVGEPQWRLDLAARAAADSPVWVAWPGTAPSAGQAEISMRVMGKAPPLADLVAAGNTVALLLAEEFAGSIDLFAAGITVPDSVDGLNLAARLSLDARAGTGTVALEEPATMAVSGISPEFLQSLGIPTEIANQVTAGVTVKLEPPPAGKPVAVVSGDGDTVDVALDGKLTLTGTHGADLSMTLPADIRIGSEQVHVALREPAILHLTKIAYGDIAELLAPADITLDEATITLGPAIPGLEYRVVLDGPPLRLRWRRPDADAIDATVTPGRVTATPSGGEIGGARIELPAYGLVADGVSAVVESADNGIRIDFQAAHAGQTGDDAMVASMALTGQAIRNGDIWKIAATGTGPGGAGQIDATGTHDGATARGKAHIELETLRFKPGGVQPGVFLPALKILQDATGSASAKADLSWTSEGLEGAATVSLADMTFTAPQVRVEGMNLDLHLDSLLPPSSPPRQTLTVRRLEPGLPLDRLAIEFQIRPTEPPSLAIETGEVMFGSGRFAVSNLVVDPAVARRHVDLRVEDLSLAELFAILGLDGLSGEGRLSGTIPMDFADGTVVIENGHLAAGAPGVIQFRSEKAAQILAGQGESLDLVLRALEDFRYDELTVDLDKTADDVGRMKLSLLGKNPAVLEGHPFQFNINVEANTGKLITALTTIYQVPNDLLRRAWTSRP